MQVGIIPSSIEGDSFRGFPDRQRSLALQEPRTDGGTGRACGPLAPVGQPIPPVRLRSAHRKALHEAARVPPIALREDFDGPALRRLAKASKDAGQSRRLLALAEIYDGGRRTEAARIGTVIIGRLQVVRDWVLRFNAKGPDGLIDGKAKGKPAKLNDRQRQALARLVESGPIPAIHGVPNGKKSESMRRTALEPKGPGALDIRRVPHFG